ncbi:hypothetical protein E2C01_093846 [Portunus trituberculatus]|uniref:Uncharacterized protein n=1 Tax=Portunus trituberculatus TaxID=210409 RepID=A0A5B7JVK5_PORTR|nr:hypothetical protein [Portunus trituberculatus]
MTRRYVQECEVTKTERPIKHFFAPDTLTDPLAGPRAEKEVRTDNLAQIQERLITTTNICHGLRSTCLCHCGARRCCRPAALRLLPRGSHNHKNISRN